MDKLFETVARRGHVCVGLDTAIEYIPQKVRSIFSSGADAVLAYNVAVIDATIDVAACYKVQIAYYEAMGLPGLLAYAATLRYLREKNALSIADIKRGDIADTASRYASAHFNGDFEADFVTLSPYMGMDAIEPWFEWVQKKGKGAFVLMRTSNKGRRDFEELILDGPAPRKLKVYDAVGFKISELADTMSGEHGYGAFGAVVGADPQSPEDRKEAAAIRAGYPNLFFLIPGYGAQGGAASDAALLLRNGNGGVVNASRSILKAWNANAASAGIDASEVDYNFAANAARNAALDMRDAIRAAARG